MALARPLVAALRRFMPTTAREVHSIGDITMELRQMQNPTGLQRRILVWSRVYKSLNDVPNRVSLLQLKKAYDVFRAEVTTVVIVGGVIGSALVIRYSQKERQQHLREKDPVYQQQIDIAAAGGRS
jgi:hypothetical protein